MHHAGYDFSLTGLIDPMCSNVMCSDAMPCGAVRCGAGGQLLRDRRGCGLLQCGSVSSARVASFTINKCHIYALGSIREGGGRGVIVSRTHIIMHRGDENLTSFKCDFI